MRSVSSPRAVRRITGIARRARIDAAELEPADPRQHDVEHDQIRRLELDEVHDLPPVAGRDHAKAVARQVLPDDLAHGGLVVDHEHGARALHETIVTGRRLRSDEFRGAVGGRS